MHMIHYYFTLTLLLSISLLTTNAWAEQQDYTIMAVVNGDPITSLELNERMDVMITSANLQDSIALRKRLSRQAIQILINEKLQYQEAEKNNISASKEDLDYAIKAIEKSNELPEGDFADFAEKQGLSTESLMRQISAQITWEKTISTLLRPKIHVSNFEIEDTMKQISNQNITEVHLSEILLPVSENKQSTLATATDLIKQIEQGANFSDIAKQFSQGSTASEGGLIGWVPQRQLNGALKKAVTAAKTHSIVPPIISEDGVRIVKIGNRRSNNATRNKAAIKNRLSQKKLELESKRFMKKLRGESFIELRF